MIPFYFINSIFFIMAKSWVHRDNIGGVVNGFFPNLELRLAPVARWLDLTSYKAGSWIIAERFVLV